ncbi:Serine/threonine-protein kinase [Lachnellula occidentalis]|uniref:Serine/threonine-protein kinase n=1 Tax=Lachnellula occidentalis TaxID=215460 RepID=A0A8H8S2Y0_9HELO|nr:Serine/threonine-protein kinase [Lachnellula occidentalis]
MGGLDSDTGEIKLSAVLGITDVRPAQQLLSLLDDIQGSSIKQRTEGIKDLKTLFDPNSPAKNVSVLGDKAYHKIYEVLFQAVISEKANLLSARKTTVATTTARLTACADAVRIVVKAGASKIKLKTIEAIVDHITQTLPTADDEYCQPLAQHYLKALSILFEHTPNAERLKNSAWYEVIDFCVQGIDQYLNGHHRAPSSSARSFPGTHLSGSTAKSGTPNGHSQIRSSSMSRQNVEDLLQTVCLLVSPSSAPIAERFHEVMEIAVRFLQTQGNSVSQVHQLAFSIVNAVLSYTCTNQISFSQSVAQDIVPVILRFWQGKTIAKDEMLNSVRDEMLMFIFAVHPHLERSLMDEESHETLTILEDLSDAIKADYTRRSDRDQLQLDDLEMVDLGAVTRSTSPFSLHVFRLKPHNVRAERNWGNLQAIGILERLVSLGHQKSSLAGKSEDQDNDQHPRKRQRIVQSSDRIFFSLKSENEKSRVSILQALPFILHDYQLSAAVLEEFLDELRSCAADKRGNVASWALLAIARHVLPKICC